MRSPFLGIMRGTMPTANRRRTQVGCLAPNAWGLHDMHGNVHEWCQDYYDERDYSRHPCVDPKGHSYGTFRVYRGGSLAFGSVFVPERGPQRKNPG